MIDPQILRAALCMIVSLASLSAMAVAGREVSGELDTFEIMFYRSIVGVLTVLAIGTATGAIRQVNSRNIGLHLLRNAFHFTGQNLWFYSLALIPLAQVISLEFTSPIWVALLAPLVLGERLTRRSGIAAILGFSGVLIIVRPEIGGVSPPMIAAAMSAIFFAATALYTRKLTRTASITCIMFWLTVTQAAMSLVCAGFDGDIAWPTAGAWPLLVVIGLAGLSGHFFLSTALSLAPANIVMPIDFLRLPLLAVVGLLLYNEPFDNLAVLGAVVIFAANWVNLRPSRRFEQRPRRT